MAKTAAKPGLKSSSGKVQELPVIPRDKIPVQWMEHCRIPRRYWEAECPDLQFAFYTKGLPVAYHHGQGLIIFGRHGAGKTYSAVGLMKQFLRLCRLKNYPPKMMFITAPDLVKEFSPKGSMFDEERTVAEVLWDRRVLVIDDLGQEYRGSQSGFAETGLLNLLRHRVQNQLVTIITTNLNKGQLQVQYGEGFISLLAEGCVPLQLHGEDLRKKRNPNEEHL